MKNLLVIILKIEIPECTIEDLKKMYKFKHNINSLQLLSHK
jgi:hypothetical protein